VQRPVEARLEFHIFDGDVRLVSKTRRASQAAPERDLRLRPHVRSHVRSIVRPRICARAPPGLLVLSHVER